MMKLILLYRSIQCFYVYTEPSYFIKTRTESLFIKFKNNYIVHRSVYYFVCSGSKYSHSFVHITIYSHSISDHRCLNC